ncbi:hypothetical protein [uncultured Dokdonia sp.]|uniref:hypothetical protein n=1 Tax=uncultured Dokdonia sp. TaxID=575653 RepID=UPI002624A763|nr:hypothetical protein [uncultured Dokdonia sp.]
METTIIETDPNLLLWQLFLIALFILVVFVIVKLMLFIKKVSHYIDLKTAYLKSQRQEL